MNTKKLFPIFSQTSVFPLRSPSSLRPMSWYQAIVTPEGALGKVGSELPMVYFVVETPE
jgi:hypothetical protein